MFESYGLKTSRILLRVSWIKLFVLSIFLDIFINHNRKENFETFQNQFKVQTFRQTVIYVYTGVFQSDVYKNEKDKVFFIQKEEICILYTEFSSVSDGIISLRKKEGK